MNRKFTTLITAFVLATLCGSAINCAPQVCPEPETHLCCALSGEELFCRPVPEGTVCAAVENKFACDEAE